MALKRIADGQFSNGRILDNIGLSHKMMKEAIEKTYQLLDSIDETLTRAGSYPLSQTVELANLSSMIGNIFGGAIAQSSNGNFTRNGPHKYPDLLSSSPSNRPNIEIKMALELNKPKGHLAKPGYYITCRYILCDENGEFKGKDNRGTRAFIWELRCGYLEEEHFNISNTAGDSGKTAVVNKEGMQALKVVYFDLGRNPVSSRGKNYSEYVALVSEGI